MAKNLSMAYHNLSVMLDAGVPLLRSLNTIAEGQKRRIQQAFQALADGSRSRTAPAVSDFIQRISAASDIRPYAPNPCETRCVRDQTAPTNHKSGDRLERVLLGQLPYTRYPTDVRRGSQMPWAKLLGRARRIKGQKAVRLGAVGGNPPPGYNSRGL